jgi:hypothetical protein
MSNPLCLTISPKLTQLSLKIITSIAKIKPFSAITYSIADYICKKGIFASASVLKRGLKFFKR